VNWKKILGWTAVGILSLILFVVIAAVVLLHSSKFHNYVLSLVEQKASTALNARVQVHDFTLDLHNLTVALNGVAIETQPGNAEPLLTADRLYTDLNVISLLRREWYVNDIDVQHPVVHIYVDKAGNNNLPKFQSSGNKSNTNLFQLGIRHALLSNGEVYYNDQKQLLNADVRDLTFKSTYANADGGRYSGELSYRIGHIQYGHYTPLPHDMDAKFDATPAAFKLSPAVLSVGDSRLDLSATITDYEEEDSAMGRIEAWEASSGMMAAHPLTGVGFASFGQAFPDFSDKRPRVAHNTFFQIGGEWGVIAGITYLTLLFSTINRLRKNGNRLRQLARQTDNPGNENRLYLCINEACLLGLTGFFVCSMFLSLQGYEVFYYLLVLANATLVCSSLRSEPAAAAAANARPRLPLALRGRAQPALEKKLLPGIRP